MDAIVSLSTRLAAAGVGALIAAVWQGLVLAGGTAICLRLLPGLSAAVRSRVWSAILLSIAALPFVAALRGAPAAQAATGVHLDVRLSLALAIVWAWFSTLRASQLAASVLHLRRLARNARPCVPGAALQAVLGQSRRKVAVCISDEVDRPSVVGFSRPKILLPPRLLERLPDAELGQIALHELEHLRRWDDWINLGQKLCLVAFPLNPALIWIERRMCLERELACDDRVVEATGARKAYAACLAALAEHRLLGRGVSLALGAWERQSEVARRVQRILRQPQHAMARPQMAVAAGVLMAAIFAGGVALIHAPQLVSFAPVADTPAAVSAGVVTQDIRWTLPTVEAPSRPRLIEASLPVRQSPALHVVRHRGVRKQTRSRDFPAGAKLHAASTGQPERTALVVLVDWEGTAALASRATVVEASFHYAAVPVGSGWMLLEL